MSTAGRGKSPPCNVNTLKKKDQKFVLKVTPPDGYLTEEGRSPTA